MQGSADIPSELLPDVCASAGHGEGSEVPASACCGGEALAAKVRRLLRGGADADAVDSYGRTAALICVLLGEAPALSALLEAAPDLRRRPSR
jgi:hypothetical protein